MENDEKTSEKQLCKTIAQQQDAISQLTETNKKLIAENVELRATIATLEMKLEKALLYIEELQKIVFRWKKPKGDAGDGNTDTAPLNGGDAGRAKRDGRSYRRANPNEKDVTETKEYLLSLCPDCDTALTKLKLLTFYEEDIFPLEEWRERLKKITKKIIATGYCRHCDQRVSPLPIPKQSCVLGQNIRQFIAFQITVQQFSYSQVKDFAESVLGLTISDGEIANILSEEARKLKGAFEGILERIRGSTAVHTDETGWKTQSAKGVDASEGNWAWVMADASSSDVAFALGKKRSLHAAQELLGEHFRGIGVTDGYGAYKYLFAHGKHALCWAHPDRKLRDLAHSRAFSKAKKERCRETSEAFSVLYANVREAQTVPFDEKKRKRIAKKLMGEFETIVDPDSRDPEILASIKRGLLEQKSCYFVCVTTPGIPSDNNRAERELRHLVIKRKKSFGCKTSKGADALSVLYSVVMSLWRKSKRGFFGSYAEAASGAMG